MALFTINIAEEIVIPYTKRTQNITLESCNTETLSYGVSIYNNTPEQPLMPTLFLLGTYTGAAWKTLTISNIVYSHFTDFYLEYQSTPMNINTTYNIDVTLLSPGGNVTDLLLKNNITAGNTTDKTISYDISITDINDVVWGVVNSSVGLTLVACTTPLEPIVTDLLYTPLPPTSFIDFTVTTAPFSNINFSYIVEDKSSGGFTGKLLRLDTPHGNTILETVTILSNTLNTVFNVIYNGDVNSEVYFRFIITTKGTIPPGGPESETFTDATLFIKNNANTATIQSLTIFIGETTVP